MTNARRRRLFPTVRHGKIFTPPPLFGGVNICLPVGDVQTAPPKSAFESTVSMTTAKKYKRQTLDAGKDGRDAGRVPANWQRTCLINLMVAHLCLAPPPLSI